MSTSKVSVEPRSDNMSGNSTNNNKWRQVLLTLPQPACVLGGVVAVATAHQYQWIEPKLFSLIMIVLPLPLILLAERIWTKRQDWNLTPKELAEDAFWLATSGLIWVPFYSDYYRTPISDTLKTLRDQAAFDLSIQPTSVIGLILAALLLRTLIEFIYYWLHRLQHRYLFFWRMHATHHHITKMGAARADRTHPLEYLALMIGSPIIFALSGASDQVLAVAGAFTFMSAYFTHAYLPLRSGLYGWFFTTPEQHHLHHSIDMASSNTNYGCLIIVWDRLFGTYSGRTDIAAIGAGSGKALSIWEQYKLPFVSSQKLTKY